MVFVRTWWKHISLTGILSLLALLDYGLRWGILSWLLTHLVGNVDPSILHWENIAPIILGVFIAIIYVQLRDVRKHVPTSFKDDFKKDLKKNWEFQGKWELVHGSQLSVTQSDAGGITRTGHLWRDYSFEFGAVIVNECIGWIVRAQDTFSYYMIQLTPTMIRPHFRFRGQWVLLCEKEHNLPVKLNELIQVRTDVTGPEIRVLVNGKEAYYDNEFFAPRLIQIVLPANGGPERVEVRQFVLVPAFTTGRVGFRLDGQELGRFSRCRVRLL